ncbi:DUF1499 domain-containing protein [Pelobacter sp. M08fum]|uniref:DUF1499 domain-containing protein n=2 Tax=Pelovirga terrestris TaxID=2771352 RepID=A0A8J6UL91_9BACT|nr:DUF1499 domain-containing protein [Pelovirga terrestris]
MCLMSCAGNQSGNLGVTAATLSSCHASPNCVCSDCDSTKHQIDPFILAVPALQAWQAVHEQITALSRTRIISFSDHYLHAECRSAVFGFVDDLELHLRPEEGIIAVRSAARLGYYDFGVNRKRIETLRSALRQEGVVR